MKQTRKELERSFKLLREDRLWVMIGFVIVVILLILVCEYLLILKEQLSQCQEGLAKIELNKVCVEANNSFKEFGCSSIRNESQGFQCWYYSKVLENCEVLP